MSEPAHTGGVIEAINLIGVCTAIRYDTTNANTVVLRFSVDCGRNSIHRKNGVKVIGSHYQCPLGML